MVLPTLRWTFTDVATDEQWTLPINPDEMQPTGEGGRELAVAYGGHGGTIRGRTVETHAPGRDWEFSGVIRSQAQHDMLEAWSRRPGKIHVSDHLGRIFEVMFTDFATTERRPTPNVPWRLRYTMKAILLRRIT